MKYKKSLLIICLIICLFSIASVCASDVNETVVTNEDQIDEIITVENQNVNEINDVDESNSSYDVYNEDLEYKDNQILSQNVDEDILGASPPYTAYSVSVSDTTIDCGTSGSIKMTISSASSSYSYRYDYYLKVYDSNNNEKINQRYYSTSSSTSKTYSLSSNQLSPGTYTIRIVNYYDSHVMSTAKLNIIALTYDSYSVDISNTEIHYGFSGSIKMRISSASSAYYKKYDYYLKVYDSKGNEKISQRYSSTSSTSQNTYSLSSNQLEPGTYTVKIINYYDNQVMSTANLNILSVPYNAYSVSVSNTSLVYGTGGNIVMNITPASPAYTNRYDFYLNVYDSDGNQKISKRYYSSSSIFQINYSVSSTVLNPGMYTIQIINTYDNHIMNTANLTVISVPYDAYSVNVSNTSLDYRTSGSITMNISPASSYYYTYDYYLKIYDSNNNEKISKRYYSTYSTTQNTYSISSTLLEPGKYTIKLLNNVDNHIMNSANLTVLSVPYDAYSVRVYNTTIINGTSGSVTMSISSASSSYKYKYDYYLKIYDSNGTEKINQRYYSTSSSTSKTYSLSSNQLSPGIYTIKIINTYDNYIMSTSNLDILALTYDTYSLNVSNTTIPYGVGGKIIMNITPSSSMYSYKYDYNLKVYDSKGNQKISYRYYSTSANTKETYSVSSSQLTPGNYTIKLINNYDNQNMATANLIVTSVPHSAYSVNVSDITIIYNVGGNIIMNITPASSSYKYKYDFYLKVYSSSGIEKISSRQYSSSSSTQITYYISSTALSSGNYIIKLINSEDNYVMDSANLTVLSLPHDEYSISVSDTVVACGSSANIIMSITPSSSYYYKYDYYLKIYDSNNNEKISKRYYSTSTNTQETYSVSSSQLTPGNYTIKILNNGDNHVMSCANLTVLSVPYNEYSVDVSDTTIKYGNSGTITMNIAPTSLYNYKYDYYLKVYDSNNNEKITQRYYSTSTNTKVTYSIGSTQLENGNYKIKIINTYDNHVMATANLNIIALTYDSYSVDVNDTKLVYGTSGKVTMNIVPSSSQYDYKYDFYMKVYDSNGNEKITQRYYSTSTNTKVTYSIGSTQLENGNYKIKIINTYDNHVMAHANLTVFAYTFDTYSVNVSDTTSYYGLGGLIAMNITNLSPNEGYDFYLRVYDSNGNEKINKRYYNTNINTQLNYTLSSYQLNQGIYTIQIMNTYDNHTLATANLTVLSAPYNAYSVNVSDTTIAYGTTEKIIMNINPASSPYYYKYDYYLKIYDSNNSELISQRYYSSSSSPNLQTNYNIGSNQLEVGNYTIKILNNIDNNIIGSAKLTVIALHYDAYSVNVSDTTSIYGLSGEITINITPASLNDYKYNFYMKVYDSNGNEKINKIYYNTTANTQITYTLSSYQLNQGMYTIQIINIYDNHTMATANLTVLSAPYNAYSVNVSDMTINYGSSGTITMNINPASSPYYYKYDYYLKVYDSNGNEKISKRYYSTSTNTKETYSISSSQLGYGTYTIKILNNIDNHLMDVANLLVPSVPHSAYLVSVSNTTVTYGSSGSIVMSISPASSYNYKYDFYLKVYDSKGNEKISKRYYSTSSSYQVTYSISSNQLDPGNYIIKIINNHEGYIMSTANLTVISVPYDAYSVSVPYTTITYGIGGEITMNINPASSSYKCRYDFYMKVYDSNDNEKITQRYYSTSTNTKVTYSIGSTQLENGNYKIKIINMNDNHTMATANLTVKTLTYNEYSVNVSDTTLISGFAESIIMNISPASSYNYKYDFYLNVYDSNGNQKIGQRYYSTYSYTQVIYSVGANQFEPGNYTIRITNTYDNHTMTTANLTVKALTYDTYSINISDTTITYWFDGSIVMNITPSSPIYQGKYDYYLVIYDSYGSEQIYERFISSSNPQPTYYINNTQLTPGKYTIRIFNYCDGKIMDTADLTVIALNYTSYSANVFNTTITYGIGGSIVMNITPASQIYQGKYDYYMIISDSNSSEKISQRYYSTVPNTQETYNINPTQLMPGHYKIKLINAYDNYILATANLTVLSVPHSAYSVNVPDIIINYGIGSSIVMNITPASSQYNYKYDFYLKLYDSQGNEKISQQYYSTTSNTQITYNINSYQISPGNYTIKLLNNIDNYTMDSSNLTVIALTYDSYSVNVSSIEIAYGTAGSIIMNITPASSIYSKKYDYYLRIYDSDGVRKINQRYYSTNPNTQETYNINPTQLNPGNYKIELVNYYDYNVMDTANLTITSVPYTAYSVNVQDNTITYENGESILMNITSNSNSYYKYDFYLEIYDTMGYKKISQRYCSTTSNTQETYKINPATLTRGNYTIKILNNVDNHLMDSAKLYIIESPNFKISSQNYNVGEIAKIAYTINSEATGNLSIFVNGDFVKNVSLGNPINLANLSDGEYTVKVVYTSDNYFASSEDTTQFRVYKRIPNFTISANDIIADDYEFFNTCIIAGNNVTFKFIFDSDATGVVNITFEKYGNYSCELVNGVATVFISNIKAWDYTYSINYNGDYKYNSFECEGQINIEYKSNSIDFEVPGNIIWGDSIIITPILPEDISPTYDDMSPAYVMVLLSYPNDDDILFSDRMKVGESYNLTVLYGGSLVISLWTPGDEYYGIGAIDKEIYVHKLNSTYIIPDTVEAGDYVPYTVTLNEDATGDISVGLDNNVYSGVLTNGTFTFEIPNIKIGTYNAIVNYEGDTKYNSIYLTKPINVTYKKSNINLTIDNILTGKNIIIRPIVSQGATGTIEIYYDDVFKSRINVGSTYTLSRPEIGKHEVKVVYSGDDYFASSQTTTVFRVFTIYPIESEDTQILFNSDEYFQAKFYDEYGNLLTNKYVVFNVNGTDYARQTNSYGIAILDLKLPIGSYEITITNPSVNENTKNTLLIYSSINATDMVRAYNSGVDFNATFLDDSAKALSNSIVIFKVNGTDYTVFTDINGVAKLNVPLSVGTYEIISINTQTNENTTNKLTILPTIQANDMIKAYNSSIDFKATFLDKSTNPLANAEVTFEMGLNTYKVITNSNGQAILNVPLAVGGYNITSINPVTGERLINKLTILPRIVENQDMITFSDAQDYFTVKVVDDDGNPCLSGETVVFNLNNTIYNIKTDANGYASLIISLDKGLYPISVTYKGFTATNNILVLDDLNSIINIEVEDINYTQSLLLNVSLLPEYNNGNITVSIIGDNGYEINFTQKSDGIFAKELTGLNVTNYVVVVEFTDYENYYYSKDVAIFEVSKITPNLIVVAYDAEYGQNVTITINIPNVSGNVTTRIGNEYLATDFIPENGVIVKRINTLDIGDYQVEVTYNGNDNYKAITKTAKLNISRISTSISVESEDVDYGESVILNITASVEGVVKVQIANDVQFINVNANELYKLVCANYDAGNYEIHVNLTPNDNHYENSYDYGYVNVYQINPNLYVYAYDIEIDQPTNITVTLNSNVAGLVRLELNNVNYTEEIVDGTVKFNIEGLSLGNYTVHAYFDGNVNFYEDYDWDIFEVTKVENLDIDIPEEIEGDNDAFSFNMPEDATGTVSIIINGKTYSVDVINGTVSIDLSNLTNGNYTYTLVYSGDEKYSSFTRNGTINMNRVLPTIKAEDLTIDYGSDYDFKATFFESDGSPLSNVYIVFNVNGDEHTVKTDSNGLAVLKIGLEAGNYTITSMNIRTGETKVNTLTVNAIGPQPIDETQIDVPSLDGASGGSISVKLPDDATGTITLNINGKNYDFDVVNGTANVEVPDLSNGDYTYAIIYSGDDKYASFTRIGSLNVNKIIPTQLAAAQITTVYNGGKYLIITLKDTSGNVIKGNVVSINLNGKLLSQATDSNGQVKFSTNGLAPKIYTASITFAGNGNYAKSTASAKVTVKKATPKITAKAKTFKRTVKIKKYSITLKTNQNKVMKSTKVYIKVNKKTYAAKTNSKGVATFKITKLTKKGRYTAVVTYKGNAYYNKLTKKVKIAVK